MPSTMILERKGLRDKNNLKAAQKAFDKGFSNAENGWKYAKNIGALAMWVEANKKAYVNPGEYGVGHTHSLGGGGFFGTTLAAEEKKSFDGRAVFKVKQIGATYYLWVYAVAMHNGKDIGNYQCFPPVIGKAEVFQWVRVEEKNGRNYFTTEDGKGDVSA